MNGRRIPQKEVAHAVADSISACVLLNWSTSMD